MKNQMRWQKGEEMASTRSIVAFDFFLFCYRITSTKTSHIDDIVYGKRCRHCYVSMLFDIHKYPNTRSQSVQRFKWRKLWWFIYRKFLPPSMSAFDIECSVSASMHRLHGDDRHCVYHHRLDIHISVNQKILIRNLNVMVVWMQISLE